MDIPFLPSGKILISDPFFPWCLLNVSACSQKICLRIWPLKSLSSSHVCANDSQVWAQNNPKSIQKKLIKPKNCPQLLKKSASLLGRLRLARSRRPCWRSTEEHAQGLCQSCHGNHEFHQWIFHQQNGKFTSKNGDSTRILRLWRVQSSLIDTNMNVTKQTLSFTKQNENVASKSGDLNVGCHPSLSPRIPHDPWELLLGALAW